MDSEDTPLSDRHPCPTDTPARRGRGRIHGSKNRKTLIIEQYGADIDKGSVREVIFAAFDALGGLKGLVAWAEKSDKNRVAFYTLWSRMGPRAAGGRRKSEAPTETSAVVFEDFSGENPAD